MYYLLNQTHQIIAADENLLAVCGVSHIDELNSKIILGDTTFEPLPEDKIMINKDQTYTLSKTSLSSMIGTLTLVNLELLDTKVTYNHILDMKDEDSITNEFALDDREEENIENRVSFDLDSDLISIMPDADEDTISLSVTDEKIKEDFTLDKDETLSGLNNSEAIPINIKKISQSMGITHEDYNSFLNEYIDTAIGLESDLHSNEDQKRINAINTLSQLSNVLHLSAIDTIIEKLAKSTKETQKNIIQAFYNTLSRLTTQAPEEDRVKEDNSTMELYDIDIDAEPKTTGTLNSFGTIDLQGIKPIHFDFQLEEAAHDLSLPVELIKEFVHDFIDQAHVETIKMLEAYEKGDLDTIQKIGHLLKGASSNLRINALSDTLYQIQFCEEPGKLDGYIKDYWGHFLSFEIQINALAK